MNKKLTASKKAALGGMVTAITALCLYAASILPAGRVPLLFLAAIAPCILTSERAYGTALLAFMVSSGIGLLMANMLPVALYIALLGHYGIFCSVTGRKVVSRPIRVVLKLLYANMFICAGLYIALRVFGLTLALPGWLPVWALIVIAEIIIAIFDVLFDAATKIYLVYLRHIIVK
ncbi:MAG: hypothetical protein LBS18_05395 [Clostridiales bacterium]|nr:hypothetical protein [Clostridiales bacterium]